MEVEGSFREQQNSLVAHWTRHGTGAHAGEHEQIAVR
jgi:hypothetical protein